MYYWYDVYQSFTGEIQTILTTTLRWSISTKPEKWAVMYLYVKGICFAYFDDFPIGYWNCSDSAVYFVFILLHDCKHSFKWNLKCFRSSIFMFRTSWFICSQRLVTFNILHVPIFWLWTHLMMIISETHHVH